MLSIQGLAAKYGSCQALFDIDMEVKRGEVVGLIGRNGMGRTTVINCLFGLLKPAAGSITFDGQTLNGMAPYRVGRLGLSLVPEGRQIFPTLTVEENLIATSKRTDASAWTLDKIYGLFPRLKERRSNLGTQLSGGEQQMLAIGRALVTNPRLLILDEATEGLAPKIREEIWNCLARLRQAGQTILVIDKYVERLLSLADQHVILERGKVVWTGDSPALDADRGLWERYLGV